MNKLLTVLALALIVLSCSKKTETPSFGLSGNVTNVTGRPVKNITVFLYKPGETTPVASVVSDASGVYLFQNIPSGNYDLKAMATGYTNSTQSIVLSGTTTINISLLGTSNVSGLIIDSQTGQGLTSATVSFFMNQSTPPTSGENSDLRIVTGSNGSFTINNAPTGQFVGIVEITGYYTRTISQLNFTPGAFPVPQQTLVHKVPAGQLRVILTWGATPLDLDTHLTGPAATTGTNRFHLFFGNKIPISPMSLDVDDISGFGPETTTLASFFPGVYRFSVFNYSNQTSNGGVGIQSSPAVVELYDANGLVQSFSPPTATAGNTWKVFELNFTSISAYTLNTLNVYSTASSSTNGAAFRSSGKSLSEFKLVDF